ncbi:MAG: hypothetical protein DRJ42_13095 [Deltaproteobacteria bacterium]|nr:MAG: hypothetical protein DRJ42_13095 [Deltaproteobacteria bacterium]
MSSFALVGLLAACGERSNQSAPPTPTRSPTPVAELGVPDDYLGPIDPEWPPSHAADIEVELRAGALVRERIAGGEDVDLVEGEALIPGDTPGIFAHAGRIGGFDYIEAILGHVDDPDAELPLVVLLHGRGDRPRIPGHGLAQDLPVRVFIPRAPDRLGEHGYTWLATWSKSGNTELLTRSLAGRADELAPAIEAFRELRPTRGKPVLVGFSQGAIMSYGLIARHPQRFAAAFVIAGWLPPALVPESLEEGVEYPYLHAVHGTADETVPIEGDRESVRALRALGLRVGFTEVPGLGHEVNRDIGEMVRSWLRGALFPEQFPEDERAEHADDGEAAAPQEATICGPESGATSTARVRSLRSRDLRAVQRAVRAPFMAAKRSAAGLHRQRPYRGRYGTTYRRVTYRLGGGACAGELENMVTDLLGPSPMDPVFYKHAVRMTLVDAAHVDAAFNASDNYGASEAAAKADLARAIAAEVAAHPELLVFVVDGGWGDAVGSREAGVAIVDPRTREALWVFSEDIWAEG